jgi:hypothetical protein
LPLSSLGAGIQSSMFSSIMLQQFGRIEGKKTCLS